MVIRRIGAPDRSNGAAQRQPRDRFPNNGNAAAAPDAGVTALSDLDTGAAIERATG